MANLTRHERADLSEGMEPRQEHAKNQGAADPSLAHGLPEVPEGGIVEWGGLNLVDALNASLVAARPKPRGLLAVPAEVETIVAQEEARLLEEHGLPLLGEARQRLVNSLTLQYYY